MKSKTRRSDKINIITLGCSKNLVDSEVLGGQLKANQKEVVHENSRLDHNIVVVNTCGFIDRAKEESIQTILHQVELKQKGKLEKVYVTGCLSERYKTELAAEIPEVDAWFGNFEMAMLLKKLNADYKKELLGERMLSTPKHYAYLKISEGCNRTCAFCAIPLMRGKHISKPIEAIIEEAKRLASDGVKEIMLIAQELTYYGLDLYKDRKLPHLLKALAAIEGIEWIRLHYAYPTKFPLEILDIIATEPKVCKYLDLPLQHASDKLLKAMKRNNTQAEIETLIDQIKTKIPNIALRTSFIIGFPGETAEDIEILKQFLQKHQFDRVGLFKYSHEENTAAYDLEDNIPDQEKEARIEEIMELQQAISLEKNQAKIGKVYTVLIDRKEAGKYIGRTAMDSVEVDNEVIINTPKTLKIGRFVSVKITKAYDYDIEGIVV